MRNHLTSYEVPVLLSRGFKYGITQDLLWGKDHTGQEYQVIDNGQWLLFGRRRMNGGVDQHVRMIRDEFDVLFPR